jgi:hypothetical protein
MYTYLNIYSIFLRLRPLYKVFVECYNRISFLDKGTIQC